VRKIAVRFAGLSSLLAGLVAVSSCELNPQPEPPSMAAAPGTGGSYAPQGGAAGASGSTIAQTGGAGGASAGEAGFWASGGTGGFSATDAAQSGLADGAMPPPSADATDGESIGDAGLEADADAPAGSDGSEGD